MQRIRIARLRLMLLGGGSARSETISLQAHADGVTRGIHIRRTTRISPTPASLYVSRSRRAPDDGRPAVGERGATHARAGRAAQVRLARAQPIADRRDRRALGNGTYRASDLYTLMAGLGDV